jgi:thioredoxin-related protein
MAFKDKLEVATNVLIIIVVLLIGGTYLKSHLGHHDAELSVGEKINTPRGYDWHRLAPTLVVAVRDGCVYCERSYPLYKRLEDLERDNHLKAHILMVMPDDSIRAAALLSSHGITSQTIAGTPLTDIKVSGTPTLLLVDADGRLLQSWIGELNASKADALIAQLRR